MDKYSTPEIRLEHIPDERKRNFILSMVFVAIVFVSMLASYARNERLTRSNDAGIEAVATQGNMASPVE